MYVQRNGISLNAYDKLSPRRETPMSHLEYRLFYQRNLPHYQPAGATLFVTFRLAGSIPRAVQEKLIAERDQIDAVLAGITDPDERSQRADLENRRLFGQWDDALDNANQGPIWLRDPRIAEIATESLHHRDDGVYALDAYCIMPNHVHLVCTPAPKPDESYHALSAILHSLKRYTARRANEVLGRSGQFWQHENYDRAVRDEDELHRILTYVMNNPVKAGLVTAWEDWNWTYVASLHGPQNEMAFRSTCT